MYKIIDVKIEHRTNPMGIDVKQPRISWKLKNADHDQAPLYQKAYQIKVGTKQGMGDVWDSNMVESDISINILYEGSDLKPCTRYYVTVITWDGSGNQAENNGSWFETGFLNPSVDAWHGAKWIGAPEQYFCAKTLGVFVLTSKFKITEGSKAGLVFGANDERLMDPTKNQYEISGENYIRYVVDISKIPAKLSIYRVGYAPTDQKDVPFAETLVVPYDGEDKTPIINEENCRDIHEIKIEVIGNCAYTYIDNIRVDAEVRTQWFGPMVEARQLNPLGFGDTTTFPRLCEFGAFVEKDSEAVFEKIAVNHYRTPKREIACFTPGRLSGKEQEMYLYDASAHSIPMFRTQFSLKEKVVSKARLYITARGIYDCRLNGKPVTETLLNPGLSQYDKHIMYQTYDVTDQLRYGENAIGVTLASGWWCDSQTFTMTNYNYFGDQESFLSCLAITYEDGETEYVVSDEEHWDYYGEGPYTYAGMFQGEHLDGRRITEFEDFSKPEFSLKNLDTKDHEAESFGNPIEIKPVVIEGFFSGFGSPWPTVDHEKTKIVGDYHAPVGEVCRLQAKSMTEPRKGVFVYDLEQEIAGTVSVRLKGKAGTVVTIRYGEMLYPKLEEYGNLHGMILTENYRDAESIDKYILRGDEEGEIYCPRFTVHGYRYIEISGIETAPDLEDVYGIQLSSVKAITGEIETSHPLVNRFLENVRWSQLCNFISIPTDCPQRNERMGWAGDTHVFCKTATYQSDVELFYEKYLQSLKDLQTEEGKMPDIAPVGGGFGGITYECAMIFMVWELYQQYADTGIIRKYYEAMKRWAFYITDKGMPGPAFVGPLGDWLAPEEADNNLVWNAFYYRAVSLLGKMATIIGKLVDAKEYAGWEEKTKVYWNETFVDAETGKTKRMDGSVDDTQCSYALPIAFNLMEEEKLPLAFEHLARKTREIGYTVGTGFFGTSVLNPALTMAGHTDIAYQLIQQTAYPSWLFPVTQGATTIWEHWDSYTDEKGFGGKTSMNSFNHYSLGSVVSWFYETVLGIKRDESKPGFKHFVLEPAISIEDFSYAKGGIETPYGRIESSWEKTEDGWSYHCRIPENTNADLILMNQAGAKINKKLDNGCWEINSDMVIRKI